VKETFAKTNDNGDVLAAALERLSPEKRKTQKWHPTSKQLQRQQQQAGIERERTRGDTLDGIEWVNMCQKFSTVS